MPLTALQHYWSGTFLTANAFIALNVVGALLLGVLIGYERSYQGRAAGMRTYGLVCMASAALTVAVGFSSQWYGGLGGGVNMDPTRVVQGIVTGIGFLCAGVIIKDGLSIRGLTTAASIWAVSIVGVLLGAGFYAAALFLALLCMASLSWLHRIQRRLPRRSTLDCVLTFQAGYRPRLDEVAAASEVRGYQLLRHSLAISYVDAQLIWQFALISMERKRPLAPASLADELADFPGLVRFVLTPVQM